MITVNIKHDENPIQPNHTAVYTMSTIKPTMFYPHESRNIPTGLSIDIPYNYFATVHRTPEFELRGLHINRKIVYCKSPRELYIIITNTQNSIIYIPTKTPFANIIFQKKI